MSTDRGTTLIFVLVIIVVLGLAVAALLDLSITNLRATTNFRNSRGQLYAVDGGVDGAINNIRSDLDRGVDGDTQCGYAPPAGTNNVSGITVTCAPVAGSGGPGAKNQPKNAILTLATGATNASEGVIITGGGSASVTVAGGVFSNTLITLNNFSSGSGLTMDRGNLTTRSTSAQDTCPNTTKIVFTGGGVRRCGYTLPDPGGADPNYLPAAAAPTVVALPASCSNGNKVATFHPGLYLAPPDPSVCPKTAVMYFEPGLFYFNFTPLTPVWDISQKAVSVVGGTQLNWSGGLPPNDPTQPACDASSTSGVQFVFGGDSRIHFGNPDNVRFELCASASSTHQQIVLYQPKGAANGYTPPTAGGCMLTTPYVAGSASTCALIQMDSNADKPQINLHGTVYAPASALDLRLHNLNENSFFDRGLVARALFASISSSATLSNPLFSITGGRCSPGSTTCREVVFTAYRVVGTPLLIADVSYDDSDTGGTPGKTVTVKSWSVR